MRFLAIIFTLSAAAVNGGMYDSHLGDAVIEETKSLDQLYQEAISEGGKLVWYAGGDTQDQQDSLKAAFLSAFPKINLTLVIDYSKYHDARVDNQYETNNVVPDVVSLQTLQDFPRWQRESKLLKYKPAGFSQIYDGFKDQSGAWYSYTVFTFSFVYDTKLLAGEAAPQTPVDILDPKWKGKISSTYPHDDDAVLFLFKLYVDKFGWSWAAKYSTQDVDFHRGTDYPYNAVAAGDKVIGVGTWGSLVPSNSSIVYVGSSESPYVAWGQRIAILNKAKNVAAAKLFVNWLVATETQELINSSGWTVRKDMSPPGNLKQAWDIPEANVEGFVQFMEDRERVEQWKQTFALYFGEVQGAPTPGVLGLYPGQ
uniref:ABC transporter substrate-binding protein n=1 Tax=Globisporangium ultimum (strain ATCC 200006 / CBS 805.95 / DAOM BR144) TaxID=431595 RepID=K3WIY2_GLOUD